MKRALGNLFMSCGFSASKVVKNSKAHMALAHLSDRYSSPAAGSPLRTPFRSPYLGNLGYIYAPQSQSSVLPPCITRHEVRLKHLRQT